MLKDILGNHPQVKVIDYMLSNPFQEFTKQQIAVGSEISRMTLDKFIGNLIDLDIIYKNNSKYVLNIRSPIIKDFNHVVDYLVKIEISKQMQLPESDFDELSDEELNSLLDENALDVDLDYLEYVVESKENYEFYLGEKDKFNLSFIM